MLSIAEYDKRYKPSNKSGGELKKSPRDGLMWDGEFEPGGQDRGCLIGARNESTN